MEYAESWLKSPAGWTGFEGEEKRSLLKGLVENLLFLYH